MSDNDTLRAAFEKWCGAEPKLFTDWTRYGDGYAKPMTNLAWTAWQAALRSCSPVTAEAPSVRDIIDIAAHAVDYHRRGYHPDRDFDANTMIAIMDDLGAALDAHYTAQHTPVSSGYQTEGER